MQSDKEISALLRLIDDPDEVIFDTVANRILGFGKAIIPNLEYLKEVTCDEEVLKRIELLIHRVHFQDLQNDFLEWSKSEHPELLRGVILLSRFQYPELNATSIVTQFDNIRKNVWLELNNYQSAVEQVNVINAILYKYYKFTGHELTKREPDYFFINRVLETKQGNPYSLGIIYLAICEMLDITVFAVDVPRQFIFAYFDTISQFIIPVEKNVVEIKFYLDPVNGMAFSQQEVDTYLKKIRATENDSYFKPLANKRIICKMMEELALCYRYKHEDEKADDLTRLMISMG